MNPPTKPTDTTSYRAVRGGSWFSFGPLWVRAACRDSVEPAYRYTFRGFRCALRGREPRT